MSTRRIRPRLLEAPAVSTATWPDATTTGHTNAPGYPGSLTSQSGPFLTSNTTYSYKDIGQVTVGADGGPTVSNVEFYGCRFRATAPGEALVRLYGSNIRFRYCTFEPALSAPPVTYAQSYQYAVIADGGYSTFVGQLLIEYCNVWGFHDAFPIAFRSGNPERRFQHNYMHDSAATGGTAHVDFIGDLDDHGAMSNVVIYHNSLVGQANSSILGFQYGPYSNFTVTNNLLGGGGYTVNIQGGGSGNLFTDNTFTTIIKPVFGPLQGGVSWAGSNSWRRNKWLVPPGAAWGTPGNSGKFWIPNTSDASALGWADGSFVSSTDHAA